MRRRRAIGQSQTSIDVDGHALEDMILRAPIDKIRIRNGRGIRRRLDSLLHVVERDRYEVVRRAKRQRTQHHRIDDAEDRGIRANAERKGENDDSAEERLLEKRAE